MKQLSLEAMKMLEVKVGKSTVDSWFNSISVECMDSGSCIVLFPSNFVKSWIRSNYGEDLDSIIKSTYGVNQVSFAVKQDLPKKIELVSEYSMPIDSTMLFSNFVVGECNKMAYMAAERVGKDSICNPLFIHAEPGHGKTHLLQSVAKRFMNQGKRVCYISAEQYMLLFIKAIRDRQTIKFKNDMRNLDLLLIDDFQFIQGKDSTQEEVLYNFSYILSQQKCVVISADRPPGELKIDSRIKTRVSGGLVMAIESPCDDLKIKILNQKAKQYKKNIGQDVIDMITQNIDGSIRELEGALLRICAQIEFFGEKVNIDNAKVILSDILMEKRPKTITIKNIISTIDKFFNCDMMTNSKERKVVKARQIGMYLCRKVNNISLPMIAEIFSLKNHTNVIYSIKQVEKKLISDPEFAKELKLVRVKVESGE